MPSPSGATNVSKLQKNIGSTKKFEHKGISPLTSAIFMITASLIGAAVLVVLSHMVFDSDDDKDQFFEQYTASGGIDGYYLITKTNAEEFTETVRIKVNNLPRATPDILHSEIVQNTKEQINSLGDKIDEDIIDQEVKESLLEKTEKALQQSEKLNDKVKKQKNVTREDLTPVRETLSGLVDDLKNMVEENKIEKDLGNELIDQTASIMEYQSAQFEKVLIIPVSRSVNSNIQKTWYVIQKTPQEIDAIAKELSDHGFKLTATLVDLGDDNVIEGTRVTPPDTSEIQQVEKLNQNPDELCMSEYVLVFKSKDGSPACVFPESVSLLVDRGVAFSFA